ncbi:MAG: hypothetical protein ABR529_10345 [Actinomycetota bacterium]
MNEPRWSEPLTSASGIEIAALRRADPRSWPRIAREPDRAKAAELIDRYSDADSETLADFEWRFGELQDDRRSWEMAWHHYLADPNLPTRQFLDVQRRAAQGTPVAAAPSMPSVTPTRPSPTTSQRVAVDAHGAPVKSRSGGRTVKVRVKRK